MNNQTQKVTGAVTTANALKMAGYDLDGVIADVEKFDGFDDVCLQTIKRVRSVIAQALATNKEFVTLTDAEVHQLHRQHSLYKPTIKKIEAMLKEKNHG